MTTETQTESRIDVLMKSGPRALLALLLWKDRMRNPSLSVTITERDLEGLEKCVRFQKSVSLKPIGKIFCHGKIIFIPSSDAFCLCGTALFTACLIVIRARRRWHLNFTRGAVWRLKKYHPGFSLWIFLKSMKPQRLMRRHPC